MNLKKALYNIKLPKPLDVTVQDGIRFDKQSEFINSNFKVLFDTMLDLEAKNAELQAAIDKLNQEKTEAETEE